jgi:hypothetical protein
MSLKPLNDLMTHLRGLAGAAGAPVTETSCLSAKGSTP